MLKHIWTSHLPIKCWSYPIGPPSDIIIPSSTGLVCRAFRCPHPPRHIDPRELLLGWFSISLAGKKTVTFRGISDNRHIDPRLSKPASFDYLVLVEIGHRWCFKRPCPPVGCAAEWYAKPTMWRLWKCLLGKWNGYNFSNNKETD